ncbi:MAG: rhomboid family intramembrane serine protease [Anaerolineales bacterium]|nr:rhomboid family intramembrane serine protease [Anaerolineales bacterium]
MLPLRDLNPTRRFPILTYALIAVNVLVFFWQQTFSARELQSLFLDLSVVPAKVVQSPISLETFLDILRSMFFHGGWLHLLSNMLYLWLFGDNVEDRLGKILFLFLYFFSGFAAAMAQVIVGPTSQIPLVGASGAIAGVLGSYLLLFPGVRVRGIIILGLWSRFTEWPAWSVLGLWFVLQLFNGFLSLGVNTGAIGGVAFFAHIGGFVVGAALTGILNLLMPQPPVQDRRELLYQRTNRYRY